jgi:hypothetical protein
MNAARVRLDSQGEVDITPTWKDLAKRAERAVSRVDDEETGRGLVALGEREAARIIQKVSGSGEYDLRLPPKLKMVR